VDFSAVWPEIIVSGLGMLLLLLDVAVPQARQRPLGYLALAGLVAAGVVAARLPTAGHVVLGGMVILDGFSLFFRLFFLAAAVLVTLFSLDFIVARGRDLAEFLALICFATTGAMVMALSWDIVSLFVGLELLSVSSYILAAFLRDEPRSHEAGLKYLINGALASALLVFGLSLVYGLTGRTGIPEVARGMRQALAGPLAAVVWLAVGFVLAGFGFKIAAAPFHLWAPDAYEGAPSPVTGYLMVVAESAGFVGLMRLVSSGMGPLAATWGTWLAGLAILTMTVGNATALWQGNLKRMLAYSSVAQVGYILAGVAVATRTGVGSTLFYLLAYLFTTLGVFSIVVALSVRGSGDMIRDYAGLGRRSPVLAALLTLFLASYVGVPVTAGFMGKLGLIGAAVHGGMAWLAVGIAVNSAISIGYYWSVARTMWLDAAPEGQAPPVESGAMRTSLWIAAAGVLALGILPQVFFNLSNWASAGVVR
jgi:NADH-quinone oxidoreductase subunit N